MSRMQRDMELSVLQVIRPAFDAGKAAGDRQLAREEFRWTKLMERQRQEQKRQVDLARSKMEQAVHERIACMAAEMQQQTEEFMHNMDGFVEVRDKLEKRVVDALDASMKAKERIATLEGEMAVESRKRHDAESLVAILREEVAQLKRDLDGRNSDSRSSKASLSDMRQRWADDVARVEKQLQNEISARVAAEERDRCLHTHTHTHTHTQSFTRTHTHIHTRTHAQL